MKTLFGTLTMGLLLCASVLSANGQTQRDTAIGLLVKELQQAGYTDVSVTLRLLGGFVVEAQKDASALVVTLDGTSFDILRAEAYTAAAEQVAGFFGMPSEPLSDDVRGALDRYAKLLSSGTAMPTGIDVSALFSTETTQGNTAGFSQTQSILVVEDTATIRQTETLGFLDPTVTISETSSEGGGRTSHAINHEARFSRQESNAMVSISGASGFDQQIFGDPQGFRDSLVLNPAAPFPVLTSPQLDRSQVIDNVVSSIENSLSIMPEANRPQLPSDLRDTIQNSLSAAP